MCNIGIGANSPSTKLDINPNPLKVSLKGFKRFDRLMIRIVMWICERRKITVSFTLYKGRVEPNHILYVGNGNVGIGS